VQAAQALDPVLVRGREWGFTGRMPVTLPTASNEGSPSADALADLLEAIAARRDRDSFAALFDHFAPRLKGYFRKSGAGASQADDLVQDVMLILWQRATQFDRNKASASTWVYTIARNRRIDVIRRERRPEFDPNDPALVLASEPLPDGQLGISQTRQRISAAVAELPAEQAALLRLCFFEDKAHSEIAAETKLPLGTVKSRLRLALAKLKIAMREDYDADASS
jgi:RNA polymerase sigma factor (sigma-70 family)